MAEKKIEAVDPDAGTAADRKTIEAYLSSEAWEKRLAEARARREKVLSARRAAGQQDPDRPAIRPMPFPTEKDGSATVPLRPQASESSHDPEARGGAGAAVAGLVGKPLRRRAALGAAGLVAAVAVGAIAWSPALRPLSESVLGRNDMPDPAVELPDVAGFGPDSSDSPPPVSTQGSEEQIAAAPRPALPVPQKATDVPDLPDAGDGADLTRIEPFFPQPVSGGPAPAPSGFPTRGKAALEMRTPATVARPGPDEAREMEALRLPGLAIDDPVFPVPPAEWGAPDVQAPSPAPELAEAGPRRVFSPDVEASAMPDKAAPSRPAAVEPYLPLPPSGADTEVATGLSRDSPVASGPGPDAAAFPVFPGRLVASAAELTLDGIVGGGDAESVAAGLAPSLSLLSMPPRPASSAAAPSPLPAAATPRLSAVAPDFPATGVPEEVAPSPAPERDLVEHPSPRRLAAPDSELDIASLGQSAMARPGRYRLALHARTEASAAARHDQLIGAGFNSIDVTVSPFGWSSTSVFYFHEEDASAAARLADLLDGEARSAVDIVPSPAVGTLDIHVGG